MSKDKKDPKEPKKDVTTPLECSLMRSGPYEFDEAEALGLLPGEIITRPTAAATAHPQQPQVTGYRSLRHFDETLHEIGNQMREEAQRRAAQSTHDDDDDDSEVSQTEVTEYQVAPLVEDTIDVQMIEEAQQPSAHPADDGDDDDSEISQTEVTEYQVAPLTIVANTLLNETELARQFVAALLAPFQQNAVLPGTLADQAESATH